VKTRPVPRKALQQVYDMACEMSRCNAYAEVDSNNEVVGVDPEVLAALDTVKRHFSLRGKP
jgi:hypothetical protein